MGLTFAEIELANPRCPELKSVRISALADTGAMMLCIPPGMVDQPRCLVAPGLSTSR